MDTAGDSPSSVAASRMVDSMTAKIIVSYPLDESKEQERHEFQPGVSLAVALMTISPDRFGGQTRWNNGRLDDSVCRGGARDGDRASDDGTAGIDGIADEE